MIRHLIGDVREQLPTLPDASVQCCVTSPPYWGLRDYGTAKWEGGDAACDHSKLMGGTGAQNLGKSAAASAANVERSSVAFRDVCAKCNARRVDSQLGLEKTPDEYVANMVAVFREVRRVLRDDGTLWLNLGDSYASGEIGRHDGGRTYGDDYDRKDFGPRKQSRRPNGIKPKDLVGIPWRVAFALQADGWYLRSDIIWHKPNPMPESVRDRPTKAHEYVFLLTKSARYFYDADAIREEQSGGAMPRGGKAAYSLSEKQMGYAKQPRNGGQSGLAKNYPSDLGRNRRSVWTVATRPYKGAHFATFPPKLIEPCILAGTSPQACEHCAAPWERVTSRGDAKAPTFAPLAIAESGSLPDGPGIHRNMGGRYQKFLDENPKQTVGWQPTCECADNTGAGRCVVLDPFGGAGTTGLVADRLGRDATLIELNPAYAQMSRDRIVGDAPLLSEVVWGRLGGNSDDDRRRP